MKSYVAHYRNKYPKGSVQSSESGVDVYDAEGGHRVCLRKNGAGQLVDVSEEMGCIDRHDLSPLPKDARLHKLFPSGMIGLSEEAESREKVAAELAAHKVGGKGKVPSIEELRKHCKLSGLASGSESWADLKKQEPVEESAPASEEESSEEKPSKKQKKH